MSSVRRASLGLPRPKHMCWPSCTDLDRRRSRRFPRVRSQALNADKRPRPPRAAHTHTAWTEPRRSRSFVIHLTASGTRAASRVTDALDELERSPRRALDSNELPSLQTVTEAVEAAIRDQA